MAIGTSIVRRLLGGVAEEAGEQPEPLSEDDRSAALERLEWFGAAAAAAEVPTGGGGRLSMWPQ
jgi:hypothetical protein